MRLAISRRSLPVSILSGFGVGDYNGVMETIYLITFVALGLWVVFVVIAGLYIWFRIMPIVRVLRETPEGKKQVIKAAFPPRFHR